MTTAKQKSIRRGTKRNPLPALAGLLKAHAVSVGGGMLKNPHRGAKRRRVIPPRRVAPSGVKRARDMENRIAVQFHAHGVWATIKTFPNTEKGKLAAKSYGVKMAKKIPHTFRAVAIEQ